MLATISPDEQSARLLPEARLGVWDVISLSIGIVVGVSIFKVPPDVFKLTGSPALGLGIWLLGGLLALAGALCYAELSAAYPRFGAEYIYLGKAYGSRIGFLFGWMQSFVILPANVGAMSFVFAIYAGEVWPALKPHSGLCAAGVITSLTILQLLGFQTGRRAQNVLTTVKVVSLLGVMICGLCLSSPAADSSVPLEQSLTAVNWSDFGLALVFVFYAYGGWSDVTRVTPEVRDCRRQMPLALMIGLLLIALLYLLLNASYLKGLGYAEVCRTQAPAAAVVRQALGAGASNLMSLIIMSSALGAIHGMLFSGCRLLTAMGEDYRLFRCWSRWSGQHVPVWALLTLSLISVFTTIAMGTAAGHQLIETGFSAVSLPPLDWNRFSGGFELLVIAASPVFWSFFLPAGFAVIVLRSRDAARPRPFRVPFYPVTPLIFMGISSYMLWSSARYAGMFTLITLPPLAAGIVMALLLPSPQPDEPAA